MLRQVATLVWAAFAVLFLGTVGAGAQTAQDVAQMRLYVQQLEEQVRLLTGENERLLYELRQLQASAGIDPRAGSGQGAGLTAGAANPQLGQQLGQQLGTVSVAESDPRIAPDGADAGTASLGAAAGAPVGAGSGPIDLSALAGGSQNLNQNLNSGVDASSQPVAPATGGSDQPAVASLSGDPRGAYDVAYGYVLTGDYGLAEGQFRQWLNSYPGDPLANDARFWLGESQFQQDKHRDAAATFLDLYKSAPDSRKGPDALLKLGMSLAALGESKAACATYGQFGKRYPGASPALMSRVDSEAARAGC